MSKLIAFFMLVFIALVAANSVCFTNQSGGSGCYGDLTSALAQIPSGGTINIGAGLYTGSSNTGISLTNGAYTINGAGPDLTIIDCQGLSQGFNLYSGTFTMTNLTIRNCVGSNGGALYTTSTSFTMFNLVFNNNYATNGGAIYSQSNSLNMNYIVFANNYATNQGGAMWLSSVSTQLFHATFSNNTANISAADVIYCQSASINIDSSTHIPLDSICTSCPVTVVSSARSVGGRVLTTRQNACVANSMAPQTTVSTTTTTSTTSTSSPNGPSIGANCDGCCYRFTSPYVPSFILPSPLGTDTLLNVNNPIMLADGSQLNPGQGCNGDFAQYLLDNGTWTSIYTDANGNVQTNINLFYATAQSALMIRTIQSWQSNIASILFNRTVRLWITCNNGQTSCLQFMVNGYNSSSCTVQDTCYFSPNNGPSSTYPNSATSSSMTLADAITSAAAAATASSNDNNPRPSSASMNGNDGEGHESSASAVAFGAALFVLAQLF